MAEEKIIIDIELRENESTAKAGRLKEQIVSLSTERQRLAKQLKALQKEERELIAVRNKSINELRELESAGQQNTEEYRRLTDQISITDNRLSELSSSITESARELSVNEQTVSQARREYNLLQREMSAVPGSLNDQRNELIRLKRQYDNFTVGISGTQQELDALQQDIQELTTSISESEQATGRFQRKVGDYASALRDTFNLPIPASFGPGAAIAAGGAAIAAGAVKLAEYAKELSKIRDEVQLLTGATGDSLDNITARTQAIAKLSEALDFSDVLRNNNVASNLFAVSQEEAAEKFGKAVATQTDGGARLVDVFESVGGRARDAGLDLDTLYSLIIDENGKVSEQGKGVEAVAEAFVSLREQTEPTREALEGLGLNADEVFSQFQKDGFGAIQTITAQFDEFGDRAPEVGTALADIFRGAGEDAGLAYLKTLDDVNTSLDDQLVKAGEIAQRNFELQEANTALNQTYNQLLGSSGSFFKTAEISAKQFLNQGLRAVVEGGVEFVNLLIDAYNQSLVLRGGFNLLRASFVSFVENTLSGVKIVANSLKTLFKAAVAASSGSLSEAGDILADGFSRNAEIAGDAAAEIAQTYVDAYKDTIESQPVERLKSPFEFEATDTESPVSPSDASSNLLSNVAKVSAELFKSRKAFIEAELLAVQRGTEEEIELRRKGIKLARDEALAAANLTAGERVLIAAKAEAEIQALREAQTKADLEREQAALKTRLLQIEEGSNAEFELRKQLAENSRDIELAADNLTAEQRLLIRAEAAVKLQEIENERIAAQIASQLEAFDIEEANLRIRLAQRLITEAEFDTLLFEQRQAKLEAEIAQLEEGELAKIEKEAELAELRAERLSSIDGQEKDAKLESIKAEEDEQKKKQQLDQARLSIAQNTTGAIISLLGDEAEESKAATIVRKGVAAAEVGLNLQRQLSAINLASAKIALETVPTVPVGVAAAATYRTINTIAAIAGAIAAGAQIASFAEGGPTSGISVIESHSPGGAIDGPTLGLIGEAGPEWVAPNWMIKSPKLAPVFSQLENIRQLKAIPFADGGFSGLSNSITAVPDGGFIERQLGGTGLDPEIIREAVRSGMMEAPAPRVLVSDINAGQSRQAQVEDEGNL